MECPKCQHENAAGSAFCDECGTRLEASCPACGEANRPGARFCRKCGQLLEAWRRARMSLIAIWALAGYSEEPANN